MSYTIFISPNAIRDLQAAVDYYNEKSENLGFRFADLVDDYFNLFRHTAYDEMIKNFTLVRFIISAVMNRHDRRENNTQKMLSVFAWAKVHSHSHSPLAHCRSSGCIRSAFANVSSRWYLCVTIDGTT